MIRVLLILALVVVAVPALIYLLWLVHRALGRLCVSHVRRFCRLHALEIRRVRWQPQLEASGTKTEFTLVELDCLDPQQCRRLLLLSVWPFGVRSTVSDEPYPDSYDSQWPP